MVKIINVSKLVMIVYMILYSGEVEEEKTRDI